MVFPVFILRTSEGKNSLGKYFDTSDFTVVDIPPGEERIQLREALNHEVGKGKTIILIRDSSVSIAENVAETILKGLYKIKDRFDLFYLCKWQDRCDLYRNTQPLGETSSLTQTSYPHGIQAVVISSTGGDYLRGDKTMASGKMFDLQASGCISEQLANCIYRGELIAFTITPNLFEFNVNRAVKNSDYLKSQECLQPPVTDVQSENYSRLWAYLVIFLILLLIGVCVFYVVYSR